MSFDAIGQGKASGVSTYPVKALSASSLLGRVEPFLTVEQLKSRYLKGIPTVMPDGSSYTDEEFKDFINLAINEAEMLLGTPIDTVQFEDYLPFDRNLYNSYIYTKTSQKPIKEVQDLSILSADRQQIFKVPSVWIHTGHFAKGQVNIIPYLSTAAAMVTTTGGGTGNGGVAFLISLAGANYIPSWWSIKYTAGMSDAEGNIPIIVNQLIGTLATIEYLSKIASVLFPQTSVSIATDGLSQSSSGPGPQIYATRIADLQTKKEELVRKIKGIFQNKLVMGNI
jgi:hypothetical protein